MRGLAARAGRLLVPRRYHRSQRLLRALARAVDGRIVAGPFAGLRYVERSFGSTHWPKLLGTYELELQPVLARWLQQPFASVLVAGAAEGYYAVGLAMRLPAARVIAWEANGEARAALAELARRNGVEDRVELHGICDVGGMAEALARQAPHLVVADLDGGEATLLDPSVLPALRCAWIVAETHDCFIPGVAALLAERFAASHGVEVVPSRPRSASDAPPLPLAPTLHGALAQLLHERRPPGNDWLIMAPRSAD